MDFTKLFKVGQTVYFIDDAFDATERYIKCMVIEITGPSNMTILDISTNTSLYIQVGFNEDLVVSTKSEK